MTILLRSPSKEGVKRIVRHTPASQIPFSGMRSVFYSISYKIDISLFPVESHL